MSSSGSSTLRVVLAALGGAVGGLALVWLVLLVLSAMQRHHDGGLGAAMVLMVEAPVACILGALAGVWLAAPPAPRHGWRMIAALTVLLVGWPLIVQGKRSGRPLSEHTATDGCRISPRSSSKPYAREFVVYARTCTDDPRRTINVSVRSAGDSVNGPGNLLVLAFDDRMPTDSAEWNVPLMLLPIGPDSLEITYDTRHPLLSRGPGPEGLVVIYRPDARFGR